MRQKSYLTALQSLTNVKIHYGQFQQHIVRMPCAVPPPNIVEVIKTEEKGSDVNFSVHLLNDAWKGRYDCAVLVTNDSDMAEGMRLVKSEFREKKLGLITGASLRHFLSDTQRKTILNTLLFSLVIGALFNFSFAFFIPKDIGVYFNWTNAISGFVGDRNAFAFIGLIGITLTLPTLFKDLSRPQEHHITLILIGTILALIIFSGSRTGWIGSVVMVLSLLFYSRYLFFQILKIFVISLALFWAINEIQSFLGISNLSFLTGRDLSSLGSISDLRYKTWQTGFDLFLENPFWGAGLGAGIEKIDIVIHNLYLWVLGEMGMLGILLCLPLCFSILIGAFKDSMKNPNRHQQSMLLFLLVFGGFSITHDIIYQRILWLAIGYFMATGCLLNRNEQT